MGSFIFLALPVLKIYTLDIKNQGIFVGKFSPHEISKSGNKNSKFLVFKNDF